MSGVTVRLASNEVVNYLDGAGTEFTWEVSDNGELFVFQRKAADTKTVQPVRYVEHGYAPGVWAAVKLE